MELKPVAAKLEKVKEKVDIIEPKAVVQEKAEV